MQNIFLINKPKNITSNKLLQYIKKSTNIKKIGHGGTLDPLATGVLVIGVNSGTKYLSKCLTDKKQYIVDIQFGKETTTLDLEGEVIKCNGKIPTIDEIKKVLSSGYFTEYEQEVPLYSAVKINGKELYKYARENKDIKPPSKIVLMENYEILLYKNSILTIKIDVSKGFYVRSFARDLAYKLGTFGSIIDLKRTKSGDFLIENSLTPEKFIELWNKNSEKL